MDVIGRCASKNDPQSFDFQLSTTFGRGVKEIVSIFAPDFRPKMTSTLFVFLLEDTCVPEDKIPEIALTAHKGGSYLAVTPLLREGGSN